MARRQVDSIRLQILEKQRPNTGGSEGAMNSMFVTALLHESINLMHLNHVTLHSGNLADAHNSSLPLGIQRKGFQAAHMRLLQLELSRVLDGDQALVRGDVIRERIEEGRLAGARPSRHDNRNLSMNRSAKRLGDLWPNRSDFDELF